jgi:hypothetical protein
MCGGGIPIVSDVVNAVSDVFDKADNWTEGAGELLADIDPGPAIGDAGEWIDQSIIQPALDDPLATVATVAAVATQQYWALPIIAGTATAARGGDLEDIAKSVGVAFVAAQAAPYVSQAMPAGTTIGGKIASSAATGAVLGAGGGASSAILNEQDVGQAALRGGIAGGVAGGVGRGVSEGYKLIKTELGIPQATRPNYDFGIKGPTTKLDINTDLSSIEAINPSSYEPGIKPPVEGATFGKLNPALPASTPYNQPKPVDNIFEKEGKKLVADAITGEILEEIFDPQRGFVQQPLVSRRRFGTSGMDGMGEVDLTGPDNTANLGQVTPSTYELRKFVNDAGNSTLVSFKDNKPQTPIPPGYKEVERIGAAKGGLIDSKPSTTMVKYSKKPLLAKRKQEIPKLEKTAKKGLASKK